MTPARLLVATLASLLLAAPAAGQEGARRDEPPAQDTPPPPRVTKPPQLLERIAPEYPPGAVEAGLEADVPLRITIDPTGAVTDVVVERPAGHGFDEAAVAAARRYRFAPGEIDGRPATLAVTTVIRFRMRAPTPPPAADRPTSPAEGTAPQGAGTPPAATEGPAASRPAATGALRGLVRERGTRRRLPGVQVALVEAGLEATADARGAFALEAVPPGTYRLLAVLPGYDRFEENVTIDAHEETEVAVYLRPEGGNPYETLVVGERERFEVTRRNVTRREMTTVPGTFGDPIRVIQNLPGLARSPYVTGLLLIRGSNPDDSGVYIDGHRVPLLYHFLGGPSILNPEFLDAIDLYPSGFPARFGRSIGGVVEVTTRPSTSDGVHGSAEADLIDSGAYVRAPIGDRVTIALAGRRSYVDAILPLALPEPDPGETLVVVPVYWDYQARADVDLPGADTLSFLAFGSGDTLDVLATDADDEATYDLSSHVRFHRVRATYTTRVGGGLALSLSPLVGRDDVAFAAGEEASTTVKETVVALRERLTGDLAPGVRLDTGLDLEYRTTRYDLNLPIANDFRAYGRESDIPFQLLQRTADGYALAAHAELAWDVGAGVRVIPGLRTDLYLLSGEPRASVDPRLVTRWALDRRTTLKGYAGLFHQPPQPEGLDNELGNPDLELERSIHAGLGFERKLGRDLELDVEGYAIDRTNLAVFTREVERRPDGTLRPLVWKNESVGDTIGVEVLLKHRVTQDFYGWLSYTLSRSRVRRHPDEVLAPTWFDQTHNLAAIASWRTGGGWELGARFRLVTGRPETPVIGATYEADEDDYEQLPGDPRSARMPTFHQLDVRVDKTWLFRTWRLGAYLDVINLYNAENPEAMQWDYRYRESAPVRGMPIFPTVGVRGQW